MKVSKQRIAQHFAGQIEKLANAATFVDDMHALLTGDTAAFTKLDAANALLEAHGVEDVSNDCDSLSREGFSYVNMGDSYAATLLRDVNGNLRLTTVGDYVELCTRCGLKFD
jgi:hypothetical protein